MNPEFIYDLAHWTGWLCACVSAGAVIGALDNPADLPAVVEDMLTEGCQAVYDGLMALASPVAIVLESILTMLGLQLDGLKRCQACGDPIVADDCDFCAFCSEEIVYQNYHEHEVAVVRAQAITGRAVRPNRLARMSQALDPYRFQNPFATAQFAW